ncbi:MAG: hypothetical protein V3T72_10220 [Thermoanaerobaculia bacterium]
MKKSTVICSAILAAAFFAAGSASADTLYGVAPSSDQLIAIDTETGTGTVVGDLGIDIQQSGGTTDCQGTIWYFSRQDDNMGLTYTVDTVTGAATVQQHYNLTGKPSGVSIEFGADGETLYWRGGKYLGILEPDGTITDVCLSLSGSGVSLARSKEGDFFAEQNDRLVRLDPRDPDDPCSTTDIGPTRGGITSLSYDGVLYAHDGGKLYQIDENTGLATLIGRIGDATPGTAFAVAQGCAPECDGAVASPGDLWPPNHKMSSVDIRGVVDPDGDRIEIEVTSVRQDEPVEAQGDGNFEPDATTGANPTVRAERSGQGDGRVYHLGFTATDSDGNSCTGSVSVCVPHDQGKGSKCVDQGPLYDSTQP